MTQDTGSITSIAGPVVKCGGLPSVRMYEVVRVGHQQLIGEVIEVGDDTCTVQVYEETSGLAPGEPVLSTGDTLSVELGPGLIGAIYDGIQRPLPNLREISGDFIARGLTVEGLDKEKKWEFSPDVKVGDKVVPGDFLGSVPETGIITSRIMVPQGVEGEIVDIVPEGEYTIVEPICKVKDEHGDIHEVIMLQRTPVRLGRPFKERVGMDTPLITGQRVIDTFMPLAKGGTGAIPGGFGTGKCVTGDTPILLANGDLVKIRDVYETAFNDGTVEADNEDETLIRLSPPLSVVSFTGNEYTTGKASHVYRGRTDSLVDITTRTGRRVTVTPVHKLFRFNGTHIDEVESQNLKVGDFLAVPRRLSIDGVRSTFNAYDIDPSLRVVDQAALQQMLHIIEKLTERMTLKELAAELDVSYDVLIGYWTGKNNPPLWFMKKLSTFASVPPIPVQIVKAEKQSPPFRIPSKLTNELAEWLGLFVADGHIKGDHGGIYLYNKSEQILDRFRDLTREVFNIETRFGQDSVDTTPYATIYNASLRRFLNNLGIPQTEKEHRVRVPTHIRMASDECIVHFLAGYFAGDGHFSRYTADFSIVSRGLYIDVSYLLTRLGLLYRVRRKKMGLMIELDRQQAHHLAKVFLHHSVFQYDKIDRLLDYAGEERPHFTGLDIVPVGKELLSAIELHKLDDGGRNIFRQQDGIRLLNYTVQNENPSRNMLNRLLRVMESAEGQIPTHLWKKIHSIHQLTDCVYFDQIKSIKYREHHTDVYDITVEDHHNFVGGIHPFMLHNTVTLHQLAKWADAQVVVYVGCGERGNEMTEALEEWPHLNDPQSGHPLMERTVLIANTSNMPVAAREASIYVAITIAEYLRDQGMDVALMADSTSRWAEALREISGRLGQLPSEEGYPAYLGSRLAQFYERGGRVQTLGSNERYGSVTICGAVSPPGGDFSEPVTQATLRIVKVFWALDKDLAARRFFPAINTLTSYSLYHKTLESWHRDELGADWPDLVKESMALLQKDQELREIVQLVGPDALPESERATLEAARMLKEDFLTQNALHEVDTYCPIGKTYRMLRVLINFSRKMFRAVKVGVSVRRILEFSILDTIARMKIIPWDKYEKTMDDIEKNMEREFQSLFTEPEGAGVMLPGVITDLE